MKFKKIYNGRALYTTHDRIWVARGMTFYAIDYSGKRVSRRYSVGSAIEKSIGLFRLSRQALRVGIHHLLPLANGNILVSLKRRILILSQDGQIVSTFTGYQGNKPAHQGICVSPNGSILFAEYLLNSDRSKAVNLYRSDDNGMTFNVIKTFPAGEIRHLHFVKWDPYEKCLWLGSGDYGEDGKENRLYKSIDNGNNWELIGIGSQDWRAIGVCCTPTHLVWGTDAGSCPDTAHIVRMNRQTKQLEILEDMEGPCHGCATFKDGRVLFSTGVEGGENEIDSYARLKLFSEKSTEELWKRKKDRWPLIVQYGVMRFPLGTENSNKIVFSTLALDSGCGENVFVEI